MRKNARINGRRNPTLEIMSKTKNGRLPSLASNPLSTVPVLKLWTKIVYTELFVLNKSLMAGFSTAN